MVDVLGWLNAILIVGAGFIYPIKKINVKLLKEKKTKVNIYKIVRRVHPVVGFIIIIIGGIHGYLALGTLRLHSGTLVLGSVILMGLVAIFGQRGRVLRKSWRLIHRTLGIVTLILLFIHIFYRNII